MYALTLSIPTIEELAQVVDRLGAKHAPPVAIEPVKATTKKATEPTKTAAKKEAEPVSEPTFAETIAAEKEDEEQPTYDDMKNQILAVVKKLGREPSLDLLNSFGVVFGAGAARTADISKVKPKQYAEVIAAAKKLLGAE